MKLTLKAIVDSLVQEIGYASFPDLVNHVLFLYNKSAAGISMIVSFWVGFELVVQQFVYDPARSYYTFIALTFAESVFGTIKAIVVDKEKFNVNKAFRFIPKILAHTALIAGAYNMAADSDVFSFLPISVFIYFSWHNFIKTLYHMIELKWVVGGFAEWVKDKVEVYELFSVKRKNKEENVVNQ